MSAAESELDRIVMGADAPKRKTYFFYGPPGSGKTDLALEHPGKRKLWIDVDNKISEVRNAHRVREIKVWTPGIALVNEVQAITVDPTRKNPYGGELLKSRPEGYDRAVKFVNELLALSLKPDFPYDLVVLDTITTLVNHMEFLVMFQHKVSLIQETLYEVIKRNNKTFINGLLRMPCDVIVIGHSKHIERRNKEGQVVESRYAPMITGSYALEICKDFSEAYFFSGRHPDTKWYIQTAPSREVEAARTAKGLEFEQVIDAKRIYA